jgi:hypothetical protein
MNGPPPTRTPNIGPRQIHRRLMGGWVALGVAIALLVLLLALDAPRWSRLVLFPPLWAAGLGFFQARDRT